MTETVRGLARLPARRRPAAAPLLAQHRLAEAQSVVRGRGRALSAPARRRGARLHEAPSPSSSPLLALAACAPVVQRPLIAAAELLRAAAGGATGSSASTARSSASRTGTCRTARALGGDRRRARHERLRQRLPPRRALLGRHSGIATYAYDQRGFGRSPERGIWGGDTLMTEDLRTITRPDPRPLSRTRSIAVAGESLGGAVAIEAFASDRPPAADRLVLLAPAVWGWSSQPLAYKLALLARRPPGAGQGARRRPSFVTDHISRQRQHRRAGRHGPRSADDLGRAARHALRPGGHHAARLATTSAASSAPTLYLYGRARPDHPAEAGAAGRRRGCRPATAPPTTPTAGTCCCATSRPTTSGTTSPPSSATRPAPLPSGAPPIPGTAAAPDCEPAAAKSRARAFQSAARGSHADLLFARLRGPRGAARLPRRSRRAELPDRHPLHRARPGRRRRADVALSGRPGGASTTRCGCRGPCRTRTRWPTSRWAAARR